MSELDKYKLMSIPEACKAFNICREELNKCFFNGLNYQRVGTRKKVCFKWWVDYLENSISENPKVYRTVKNESGTFKMDVARYKSIYTI
jgi:hypothetical protein